MSGESLKEPIGRRLRTGALIGFGFSCLLVLVGVLRAIWRIARGGELVTDTNDLWQLAAYVGAGTLSGVLGGLLFPLAGKSRFLAALLGIVVIQPSIVAIELMESWSLDSWLLLSVLFGPVIGVVVVSPVGEA